MESCTGVERYAAISAVMAENAFKAKTGEVKGSLEKVRRKSSEATRARVNEVPRRKAAWS